MGLCVNAEDNPQGVGIEVRRESIILGPTAKSGKGDMFSCDHSDYYGWYVEVDKVYLKKLVEFFAANPKYLEMP